MVPWIMPLYVFSGIIMAIGAYLTIRYRPYCTLKSPEREIAMELHRKKLMNESMHGEEKRKNEFYKNNTKIHLRWSGILVIATWIHFFVLISMIGIEFTIIKIMAGLLLFGSHGWPFQPNLGRHNNCINFFGLAGYSKTDQIKYLCDPKSYQKKSPWSLIDPFEYVVQEVLLRMALLINIGLDIWLGINGSLMIPN